MENVFATLEFLKPMIMQVKNSECLDKYIDQLAVKCGLLHDEGDFMHLMAILFKVGSLEHKTYRMAEDLKQAKYTQEDAFKLCYNVVQKCVREFSNNIENFQEFALKRIDSAMTETKQEIFLQMSYGGSTGQFSVKDMFSAEEGAFKDNLKSQIASLPDGDIVLYKYFDGNKIHSDVEVAEKFSIEVKDVKTRIDAFNEKYKVRSNSTSTFFKMDDEDIFEFPE